MLSTVVPLSNGYDVKITDNKEQSSNRGNTLYVGGSGPNNYTRIQDAINNAVDGDTVFVHDDLSPYREHLIIIKSINLIAENENTTEIYGTGDEKNLIFIKSSEVTIWDFTIRHGSNGFTGILIKDSLNITILECKFSDIPSMDAITVSNSENIRIMGCLMIDSMGKDGIGLNNKYISGITLEGGCINTTILGNTISNATWAGIIVLNGCYNIWISDNIIFLNNGFGIYVKDSNSIIIFRNKILNNFNVGIAIINCNDTEIFLNLCENNAYGVGISDTKNIHIKYNNFIKNRISGFFVFDFGKGLSYNYPNNNWDGNFWDISRVCPKPILGVIIYNKDIVNPIIVIPWFMIDWHPAKEPYEI